MSLSESHADIWSQQNSAETKICLLLMGFWDDNSEYKYTYDEVDKPNSRPPIDSIVISCLTILVYKFYDPDNVVYSIYVLLKYPKRRAICSEAFLLPSLSYFACNEFFKIYLQIKTFIVLSLWRTRNYNNDTIFYECSFKIRKMLCYLVSRRLTCLFK